MERSRNIAITNNRSGIITQENRLIELENDSEKLKKIISELAAQYKIIEEEKLAIVIEI
jgi:acyl-ACP thioesterase